MSDDVDQVTRDLDAALAQIDREANIAQGVGYQPDVLQKKLADIEAAGEVKAAAVLNNWQDIARMRSERARRDLLAMPPADPLLRLAPDELTRASQLRPWLVEQVAAGDPGPLGDRIEAALARKDRGELFAWMWEVEKRLDAEREAHNGVLPRPWQALADLLERAGASFTPDSERVKRAKLEQDLEAASRLQAHVDAERLRLPSERRRLAGVYGLKYAGSRW